MALLIQEIDDDPGCAGCGCGALLVPALIIFFFGEYIIAAIVSFLTGLVTILLWLFGIVLVAVLGFQLIKYLINGDN